ncbi:stalk domain-containing protein [Paenibacillus sp. PK3_47]|uniref:stalk domain-containing protein n=1 Tax=Paenibacillus sp. PK3_47 TaxID=2072642 RepID=UPI00201E343C|nr:stalk domain-containing protein [Paenibacillus sp. PK3_47]
MRFLVKAAQLGDLLNAQVGWNSKTRTATVTKDGKTLKAAVGKDALMFDGSVYITLRQLDDTFYKSK